MLSYVTGRQKNGFTSDESNTQADAETITELKKALKEVHYIMEHPEEYKTYDSVEELFEDLDNDD